MPLIAFIILVAATRMLPHPPNFTSVGAVALFAGFSIAGWRGLALPLLAFLASDVLGHVLRVPGMGFYNPLLMVFVYTGVVSVWLVGRTLRKTQEGCSPLGRGLGLVGGSIAGSTAFFLISNLGVFLCGGYSTSLAGLLGCYTAALPFFLNTLSGDLVFCFLLFGSAMLARKLDGIGMMRTELAARARIAD